MSATYEKPGTSVKVLANTRIINLGDATRITAIVGSGPTTRTIVDEAVVRTSQASDALSAYPASGVLVSKITNVPGVPNSQTLLVSQGGNQYNTGSASVNTNGQITWGSGSSADIPAVGSTYYVSYVYDCPASQYLPNTFSDKEMILAQYGAENNTTGILSVAGGINLENGAPGVMLCQATGSNSTAYKAAIDKLLKKTNIEDIVVVFPSGSAGWTATERNTVINYVASHINRAAAIGRERGLVFGSCGPDYQSDGFDVIGDASTPSTYLYTSNSIKNKNIQYIVPSSKITRMDANGNAMILDGNFAAAAVAGLRASRQKKSTPLHGFTVTGVTIEDEKWEEFEMDLLGSGNCTVLESRNGIITIRDHITTDSTNADTQEPSVVDIERLVVRSLRTGLNNTYCNKGFTINDQTPKLVVGSTASILQSLIDDEEIGAYGKNDNPATGETKISAVRNAVEPRRIDVSCSYQPLYPLKWIKVTVSVYI